MAVLWAEAAAAVVLAGRTCGAPSSATPTSERLQRKLEDAKRSLAAERESARLAIKDKDYARLLSAKQHVESLEAEHAVAMREIAPLKKANIKLQQHMERLLIVAGTDRSAEGRGKSNSESQRQAILKKRKAIKGGVAVHPVTKFKTVPSVCGRCASGLV
jgi:hypothetical protein